MSVVLYCLAVIGKILLVLLLFVAVVLLLVLLVPVRYQAEGAKENGEYDAGVKVTWLFHFLSFRFSLTKHGGETGKEMEFRILGISPQKIKKKRAENKKSAHKEHRKKELERLKKEDPEKYQQLKEEARKRKETRACEPEPSGATVKQEEGRSPVPIDKKEDAQPSETVAVQGNAPAQKTRQHGQRFKPFLIISEVLSRLQKFIIELPGNIPDWIADFSAKVDEIYGKIQKWIDFFGDPRFTSTVSILIRDIKMLIRHVAPRSMRGYLSFGFEDPAVTGKVLGALSFVRPYIGRDFLLTPDFEEKKFDGEIYARGRLVIGYIAVILTGALMHRQVRYVIRFVRGKGETNVGD